MLHQDIEDYDGDSPEENEPWRLPPPPPRRPWLRYFGWAFAACAVLALGTWAVMQTPRSGYRVSPLAVVTPPPPQVEALDQRIQALTPEQAVIANAEIAQSKEPVEPARAFIVPLTDAMSFSRTSAIDCMTAAVFYEAATESDQGQRAVAQVILNRVRHPAYPKSVCEVVFQGSQRTTGCQFSFTCDGSLARKPTTAAWDRARRVAEASLTGATEPTVGMATHYHTIWILPYWAPSLDKITTVGAHIFYRWKGFWGKRAAFVGNYTGETSDPAMGVLPSDAADGATGGLLLGATPLELGGQMTGPSAQSPPPLLQDQGGSRINHEASTAALKADEASQRPAADEASGVLVGPSGQ
jgi:spore germination cell wall hydrolase CwlJ-like protein